MSCLDVSCCSTDEQSWHGQGPNGCGTKHPPSVLPGNEHGCAMPCIITTCSKLESQCNFYNEIFLFHHLLSVLRALPPYASSLGPHQVAYRPFLDAILRTPTAAASPSSSPNPPGDTVPPPRGGGGAKVA